ncbi:TadE family type IV pilus minor pilin [Nocardioides sp.]|uniref:TadE family type IV pilus minor pilin n=1 Tax=Nocardioides sp. TaxID=35761 RepID=UPI0039E5DD6F
MTGRRAERGAATAELVMVLPALVAVTLGLVWLLSIGAAQLRVVDAARETARALARGDAQAEAVARGREVGPAETRIAVSSTEGDVVVTAKARVRGPGGLFAGLSGVTVHAEAVAVAEETT